MNWCQSFGKFSIPLSVSGFFGRLLQHLKGHGGHVRARFGGLKQPAQLMLLIVAVALLTVRTLVINRMAGIRLGWGVLRRRIDR
jgi:hypothetical protein